jgi:hypothetical protein
MGREYNNKLIRMKEKAEIELKLLNAAHKAELKAKDEVGKPTPSPRTFA